MTGASARCNVGQPVDLRLVFGRRSLKRRKRHVPLTIYERSSRLLLAALAFVLVPFTNAADDKKAEKKDFPKITMAIPFALAPGTNRVIVRGLGLTNATEIRFPGGQKISAHIQSRGKAALPDKADPKILGDTQLEVQLVVPPELEEGDVPFSVATPEGETNTNLLFVATASELHDEKEPNAGFRKANGIQVPQFVRGLLGEANDVDVFRFHGQAGERISVETKSTRYGSTLDALLTLHDARGHVLKTSDDAAGLDARIAFRLPADGDYFLSLNDAHDRGGPTYPYLLLVRTGADR